MKNQKDNIKIKPAPKVNYLILMEVDKDGRIIENPQLMQMRILDGKVKPYKSKQKYK